MIRKPLLVITLLLAGCVASPADSQPMRGMVDEYRRAGRPVQALYVVEALARLDGWTNDLAYLAGDLYFDLGDLPSAVASWERITDPDAARLRDIARAQLTLERWSAARETLRRLVMRDSDDAWANMQLGMLELLWEPHRAGEHFGAAAVDSAYRERSMALVTLLSAVATEAPESRTLRLGLLLAEHREWALAEAVLTEAVQLAPPFPEALAALGFARVMRGRDGSRELLAAVALAPRDVRVRYFQGVAARVLGDYAGAADALAQAIALEPENPALYAELGQTYRAARDLQQAERWLQRAIDVSNDDTRYRELLATFYADEAENLTMDGVSALQDLMDSVPPSADTQAGYGWVLYLMGDSALGRDMVARALVVDPANPRARYYQARILLDDGQTVEAVSILRDLANTPSQFAELAAITLQGLNP
jgi:tetratricopeptide (TPR) repeat protein